MATLPCDEPVLSRPGGADPRRLAAGDPPRLAGAPPRRAPGRTRGRPLRSRRRRPGVRAAPLPRPASPSPRAARTRIRRSCGSGRPRRAHLLAEGGALRLGLGAELEGGRDGRRGDASGTGEGRGCDETVQGQAPVRDVERGIPPAPRGGATSRPGRSIIPPAAAGFQAHAGGGRLVPAAGTRRPLVRVDAPTAPSPPPRRREPAAPRRAGPGAPRPPRPEGRGGPVNGPALSAWAAPGRPGAARPPTAPWRSSRPGSGGCRRRS